MNGSSPGLLLARRRAHNFIASRVDDSHVVADVTSETMLILLGQLARGESIANLSAFAVGIARRKVAEHFRRRVARQLAHDITDTKEGRPVEEHELLALALGDLDSSQRRIVTQRFVHDLPLREIARRDGTSISTAQRKLEGSLAAFRATMVRRGWRQRLKFSFPVGLLGLLGQRVGRRPRWLTPMASVAALFVVGIVLPVMVHLVLDDPVEDVAPSLREASAPDQFRQDRGTNPSDEPPILPQPFDRPVVIGGQVIDASGEPVADVEVRLLPYDDLRVYPLSEIPFVLTDKEGRFELRSHDPAPWFHVLAVARDESAATSPPLQPRSMTVLQLRPPVTIHGVLLDNEGQPAEEHEVVVGGLLHTALWKRSVRTGSGGSYQLDIPHPAGFRGRAASLVAWGDRGGVSESLVAPIQAGPPISRATSRSSRCVG